MTDTSTTLRAAIDQTLAADLGPIRDFFFQNPSEPLIATGSGGAETSGDFAALLYGARGGVATSVSPYTLNSYSDEALKTAKILLVSKGGHNNDIVFAHDAPEASLDLLIRSTEFFHTLCTAIGVDPESPRNPGRIDKRRPMWIPFKDLLKKQGPLKLQVTAIPCQFRGEWLSSQQSSERIAYGQDLCRVQLAQPVLSRCRRGTSAGRARGV